MGKYIIIVIIVIVVLGGGFYLMKKQPAPQQQSSTATQTTQPSANQSMKAQPTSASGSGTTKAANAVSYTAEGFQPNTITIKAGQSVTWTNNSSDDVWIASNPHPTHTDYPGFDELKGMSNGEGYSFTFTKVGKWGYHNHLNPSQQGTVVVTQ